MPPSFPAISSVDQMAWERRISQCSGVRAARHLVWAISRYMTYLSLLRRRSSVGAFQLRRLVVWLILFVLALPLRVGVVGALLPFSVGLKKWPPVLPPLDLLLGRIGDQLFTHVPAAAARTAIYFAALYAVARISRAGIPCWVLGLAVLPVAALVSLLPPLFLFLHSASLRLVPHWGIGSDVFAFSAEWAVLGVAMLGISYSGIRLLRGGAILTVLLAIVVAAWEWWGSGLVVHFVLQALWLRHAA